MGAIKYSFPGVPEPPTDDEVRAAGEEVARGRWDGQGAERPEFAAAAAVLQRRHAVEGLYADLDERFPLDPPPKPLATVTRAELVAHLQSLVGKVIAAGELHRVGRVPYGPNELTEEDVAAAVGVG